MRASKTIRIQSITAVFFTLLCSARPARAAVAWQDLAVDAALARARAEGKHVLVEFYATWCGPCHQLDAQVWNRDDIAQEIRDHYVALRLNGEEGAGPAAMHRFNAVGFPTTLIVAPDGTEVDRIFGFEAPAEFLQHLRNYRQGIGTLADLEARLSKAPEDLRLRFDVGSRWAIRGDEAKALRHFGVVERRDAQNTLGYAAKSLLTLGNYLYLRGQKNYSRALSTLQGLRTRFPRSEEATQALYPMARALHGLGRDGEAMQLLDDYVAAAPRDVDRYNGLAWFSFKERVALDHGEAVARRGLEIDPRNDSLWDTLAEILNATGRVQEAVDAEGHAAELKPDEPYYREQAQRFRARLGMRGR